MFVDDFLNKCFGFSVTELGFGLALVLRFKQFHGHDRGEAFADIIAGEVSVLFFEDVPVTRELVEQSCERCTETFFVRAALDGVDGVRERVDRFGVRVLPLQCNFGADAAALIFVFKRNDAWVRSTF